MCLKVCEFVGSLSIIRGDRRRRRGVGGRVAASLAVMLTDAVPGGAVTQGDGLRHDCPINSTQCTSHASAHQHTHAEKIRGSASIKVQRREIYCRSIVFLFSD